jgi:hypothetical protein
MPKGKTNNPNGRPKGKPNPSTQVGWARIADIRAYSKQWTEEAVDVTLAIMRDVAAPPSSRLAAAQAILDRGWGKNAQIIEATVNHYDRMTDDELRLLVEGTVIATGPNSGRVEFEGESEELSE